MSFRLRGYFHTKIFQYTPLDLCSHFLVRLSKQKNKKDVPIHVCLYKYIEIEIFFHAERSLKALVSKFFQKVAASQSNQNFNHDICYSCVLIRVYRRLRLKDPLNSTTTTLMKVKKYFIEGIHFIGFMKGKMIFF